MIARRVAMGCLSLLLSCSAWSAPAKPVKAKSVIKAQWGVIVEEGTAVYQRPDFDSPVIDYLKQGHKLRISRKSYQSKSGFGSFFKVRLREKVYGYVSDSEVTAEFKGDPSSDPEDKKSETNEQFELANDPYANEPVFFTRYLGGSLSFVNYSEKIAGRWFHSSTPMLGLKITGPGSLIDDVPLDFNLMFSFGPPQYYERVLPGPHSGFFVIADAVFQLPLAEWKNGMMTYGLGPMLTFTNFNLIVGNRGVENQELRFGAVLMGGVSHRVWRRLVMRGELKYYWEKSQYFGYLFTAQWPY